MVYIVKTFGVVMELFLICLAILLIPVMYAYATYEHIRYGDKMPNILGDVIDTVRTLYGFIEEIVAC
jgi:hypothetical protein